MNLAMDIKHMPPSPYLPHELIASEILVRLPVEPLLRFRCVCKAWRHTVSDDTSFSQAQVRRHQPHKRRPSTSLLIAPYITNQHQGDLHEKVHTPGLYLWEENQRRPDGTATLVHDMAWFPAEDPTRQTRHGFAHCDGLVMLPTVDGTVRVLNPATRRGLELPWSSNSAAAWCGRYRVENAFGFGRDPRSGLYKVARFFHHETIAMATCRLGMEMFTIGSDSSCWRGTAVPPPCPFIAGRTTTFLKGSLIWMADLVSRVYQGVMHFGDAASKPRFVRFSLEDESFSVLPAPQWYPGPDCMDSRLVELDGELALARLYQLWVEIWIYDDVDGDNPARWVRRHLLNFPLSIHPIALFDDGIVFRDMSDYLYRQTSEGSKHMVGMKALKYHNPGTNTNGLVEYSSGAFAGFNVIPYFPTLVPI